MVDLGFDGICIRSCKPYFVPQQWNLCNQMLVILQIQAVGSQESMKRENKERLFKVYIIQGNLSHLPVTLACLVLCRCLLGAQSSAVCGRVSLFGF